MPADIARNNNTNSSTDWKATLYFLSNSIKSIPVDLFLILRRYDETTNNFIIYKIHITHLGHIFCDKHTVETLEEYEILLATVLLHRPYDIALRFYSHVVYVSDESVLDFIRNVDSNRENMFIFVEFATQLQNFVQKSQPNFELVSAWLSLTPLASTDVVTTVLQNYEVDVAEVFILHFCILFTILYNSLRCTDKWFQFPNGTRSKKYDWSLVVCLLPIHEH